MCFDCVVDKKTDRTKRENSHSPIDRRRIDRSGGESGDSYTVSFAKADKGSELEAAAIAVRPA
jgi:hypothetical protein